MLDYQFSEVAEDMHAAAALAQEREDDRVDDLTDEDMDDSAIDCHPDNDPPEDSHIGLAYEAQYEISDFNDGEFW